MDAHLGLMLEQSWALYMEDFDGSNYGKIEGLFLGYSLGSNDGK